MKSTQTHTAPELASHSPIPFKHVSCQVQDAQGRHVANTYEMVKEQRGEATANAAFIVTACNNHDRLTAQNRRLVGALESLMSLCKSEDGLYGAESWEEMINARNLLSEISKEGGE